MSVTCAAGLSIAGSLDRALDEACAAGGIVGADLCLGFASVHHAGAADTLAAEIQKRLGPRAFAGCLVQGAIANGREVEEGASLAIFSATLPDRASAETFHLGGDDEPPSLDEDDVVLLFPDPFSVPLPELLTRFPSATRVLGGVASGGTSAGENLLFRDGEVHRDGCTGVVLRGVALRCVVSQGCRPIGRPFVVTRAHENVLLSLAGRPAFERLQEVLDELEGDDRRLAQEGLHLGGALDEYRDRHDHGDFLIRNLLGVDPRSGALAVSERFRAGQTVRFHVRDGKSAREDFDRLLRRNCDPKPNGALLFSCNGRGRHLFGEPHVDAEALQRLFGDLPTAGFFAGGEIGPVGGANHLHGFTASVALF